MDHILTDYDPNNNRRCLRHRTCSGRTSRSPYCPSCLFAIWGVGIGPSFLFDKEGNHAGLGLFAMRTFQNRELICYYSGRRVNDNNVKLSNSYCMYIVKNQSIDAQNPYSSIGRYINGSSAALMIPPNAHSCRPNRKKVKNNVGKKEDIGVKKTVGRPFKAGQIEIRASREIQKGEEIFISYGRDYWNAQQRVKRKREQEEIEQQKKVRLPHQPSFNKLRFTRSDIV
jgi:hypothetical protein